MSEITVRKSDLDTITLGRVLVKSGFFTDTKEEAQAIVKVLAGQELGIGPIASMMGIFIVKGRVTLSAALIGATIKRSGRYDYRVASIDDQGCELIFYEKGTEIGRSSFTIADAKQAGLTSNDTYRKFPRNMLLARALSNGARWYCPDVFSGAIYTPDELGAPVNEDGELDVQAEQQQRQQPRLVDDKRPQYISRIEERWKQEHKLAIEFTAEDELTLSSVLDAQRVERELDLAALSEAELITIGTAVKERVAWLAEQLGQPVPA